jgi:hypothetical protein
LPGKGILRAETKAPKRDRKPKDIIAETKPQANNPANPALVGDNQEISVSLRVCVIGRLVLEQVPT